MSLDDSEPAKLTEKTREEITEEEPIDEMVKPVDIISTADVEAAASASEAEESTYIKTATDEERKRSLEKMGKTKRKGAGIAESKSLSKLHNELRKHTDARKKTDLAIKDIEKQLKSLLLAHHSAIRDLKKEVAQLRKSLTATKSNNIANKKPSKKTVKRKPKKQ
jgi:hypothetical protein